MGIGTIVTVTVVPLFARTVSRRSTLSWGVEPVVAERGLAAEPGLAALAVKPSARDPEPAGDAPSSATPFLGRVITSSAFRITHAGMPHALFGDVEFATVMWFCFDGVGFRSRESSEKGKRTLKKQIPTCNQPIIAYDILVLGALQIYSSTWYQARPYLLY